MDSPGAPDLRKVNAGQNMFLDLHTFLVPARNQPLVHHVRLAPLVSRAQKLPKQPLGGEGVQHLRK